MTDLSKRLREYRPRSEWGDPIQHTICDEAADLIDTKARKIDELVKALEPFAAYIALRDEIDDSMPADASAIACVDGFGRDAKSSKITYGDFRRARTTLTTIQAAKDSK